AANHRSCRDSTYRFRQYAETEEPAKPLSSNVRLSAGNVLENGSAGIGGAVWSLQDSTVVLGDLYGEKNPRLIAMDCELHRIAAFGGLGGRCNVCRAVYRPAVHAEDHVAGLQTGLFGRAALLNFHNNHAAGNAQVVLFGNIRSHRL